MVVYLNGSYLDDTSASISIFDGGYLYGDGVFETLRLYRGVPFDLSGHLQRMADQLESLDYDWRPDPARIGEIISELVHRNNLRDQDSRCRLTVSRSGLPGHPLLLSGYRDLAPTVSAFVQPLGPEIAHMQNDGIRLKVMHSEFARGNFPQIKSLNYLTTIMALRCAHRDGCAEALLTDTDGHVLECATSNIFMLRAGILSTPPLKLGLLPGRTRGMIMDLAVGLDFQVQETVFTIDTLSAADEIFISGSVKEVVPVIGLDDQQIGDGRPGPVTRTCQETYRRAALGA